MNFFKVSRGTVSGANVTISTSTINKDAATSISAREIATVVLNGGYENLVVTVTMGGSSVNWYANGKVTIPANTTVTGDIKISASATAINTGGGESGDTEPIDLTEYVSTTSGYALQQNGNPSGSTSKYFDIKTVNVSEYAGREMEFTFIKYTSGSGTQANNCCGFVDNNDTFILQKQADMSSLGNTKGEKEILTVTIPNNAKEFKTTWFSQGAVDNGVYDGDINEFYIKIN